MPIFKYAKLVRDNIADWHIQNGHAPKVKYLEGKKLIAALCKKLHEEADEVDGALSREELVEEIADMQQILNDLCAVEKINASEVEVARFAKEQRKGGFRRGVYIEAVDIPDEKDEWAQYCRKDPNKYPEIKTI